MTQLQGSAFERFVAQRRRKLQFIAYRTRGEYQFSDVVNEAWLIGQELMKRTGIDSGFADPTFQDSLLSYLYQRLVHYTDKKIRNATRLDQPTGDADRDIESHPLMYLLASDEGRDPLNALIEQEAASIENAELLTRYSLASAYVHLLRHFGNRMRPVADHLLISVSYAYRQCAKAKMLAICQQPMPISVLHTGYVPGPWRRFRLYKIPVQLTFDFDDGLLL